MKTITLALWLTAGLLPAMAAVGALAQDREPPTPQAFCQAAGGTVSETGHRDIVVCCYEKERKCVLNNLQHRYSRPVAYAADERVLQIAREARGGSLAE
jgi:hypothetical protein